MLGQYSLQYVKESVFIWNKVSGRVYVGVVFDGAQSPQGRHWVSIGLVWDEQFSGHDHWVIHHGGIVIWVGIQNGFQFRYYFTKTFSELKKQALFISHVNEWIKELQKVTWFSIKIKDKKSWHHSLLFSAERSRRSRSYTDSGTSEGRSKYWMTTLNIFFLVCQKRNNTVQVKYYIG